MIMKNFTILIISVFTTITVFTQNVINGDCIGCKETVTNGMASTALGLSTTANGDASFVAGYYSTANGNYSISLGEKCISTGEASFSAGFRASAKQITSFAIGRNCEANGIKSFVFGVSSKSTHDNAYAFGYNLISSKNYSFVIGAGTSKKTLENNTEYSLMIGFNSTRPTFFVSKSPGLDNTGRIGIGNITEPKVKLHIMADSEEDAEIRLEAPGTDYFGKISFGDDSRLIYSRPGQPLTFKSDNTNGFFFENGKVGIGTDSPGYLLDVAGDIRFTGQLYDSEGLFEPSKWEENGDNIYYNSGNVGIGTDAPQTLLDVSGTLSVSDAATFGNNLQVNGKIKTTQLQITQNAGTDKILSSDANGNAMWMNMSAVDDGDWFTNSDGDIYHNNSWVGIGTSNPAARFELYGGDMVIGTSAKKFIFHTS